MEQSISLKANIPLVNHEIISILLNPKIYYCVHKNPKMDPFLIQLTSVHILTAISLKPILILLSPHPG